MKFTDLPLNENILKALGEKNFSELFEIQEKSIPTLLENEIDFVGQAQTGTGKTAAFSLPLLSKIGESFNHIQGIILAPTRELATQIQDELKQFAKYTAIRTTVVYGGTPIRDQIQELKRKKPQIVVGTPGRVLDLISRGLIDLSKTQYAVCDECDEMLNRGFIEDVQEILSLLSGNKHIWMFSATMPKPVLKVVQEFLDNPQMVSVQRKSLSSQNIEQAYYLVPRNNKVKAICSLFDSLEDFYGMIFCKTKIEAKIVSEELSSWGVPCSSLHGDMAQDQRTHTMKRFKKKEIILLVCTDVAARGIDVSDLSHVINFGLPQDFESYVHRIGRTGRAGNSGTALTFISPDEKFRLSRLEKFLKLPIKRRRLPKVSDIKKVLLRRELMKLYEKKQAGGTFKDKELYEFFREETQNEEMETLIQKMFDYISKNIFSNYNNEEILDLADHGKSLQTSQGRGQGGAKQQIIPNEDHVRFFVNLGKNDGITLKSFLENIAVSTSVKRKELKNVILKDDFSFLEVHKSHKNKFLKGKKIFFRKKALRFEVARSPGRNASKPVK